MSKGSARRRENTALVEANWEQTFKRGPEATEEVASGRQEANQAEDRDRSGASD